MWVYACVCVCVFNIYIYLNLHVGDFLIVFFSLFFLMKNEFNLDPQFTH